MKRLLPSTAQRLIVLGCLSLFLVLYPTVIEPNWLQVSRLDLTLPNLDQEFEQYRIVQISDIHADEWMTSQRLQRLVKRVNQVQPDAVVLTGDHVTDRAETFGRTLLELNPLVTKDGVFAVLGNHDHWSNPQLIRQYLTEAGITLLDNRSFSIERDGKTLAIAGVDDVWVGKDNLSQVLSQLPTQGAHILLVHEPDFADQSAASQGFDLQLSGHSHGGQVKIPFLGAPKLPPYGRKYPFGLYKINQMFAYTSRGVGMVSPRVRFNARPQITIFSLHAQSQKS